MTKALARKEFRELLPILLAALLVQLFLVSPGVGFSLGLIQRSDGTIPFLNDGLCSCILVVAGAAAVGLGLWQTMWESQRGTFQFLLHRCVRRETIFGVKLAVGVALSLVVAVLPLGFFGLWSAAPGTHPSPFLWSMTTWTWQLCLEIPLVYLGAFLSGLRPGRWFGSRFVPLAASFFALFAAHVLFTSGAAELAMTLVIAAGFATAICCEARQRDFS